MEVGVAAVNDDVAWLQHAHQFVNLVVYRLAVRHHDPDCFGAVVQLRHHILDGLGWHNRGMLLGDFLCLCVGAIESNYPMSALRQPHHHVATHAAQANETDFHNSS